MLTVFGYASKCFEDEVIPVEDRTLVAIPG
jgi:hypothetical protein